MWLQPPRYRCDALPTELWSLAGSTSGANSIYTRCMKRITWSIYDKDKDHMSELRIENRSERDLRSCEVTFKKQLQIKPRRNYLRLQRVFPFTKECTFRWNLRIWILPSPREIVFFLDKDTFHFIWLFSCFVLFCLL